MIDYAPPPRWGSVSSSLPGALVDRSRLVRDIALGTVAVGLKCIWTDDPNQLDRLSLKCYAIVAVLKRGIVFMCSLGAEVCSHA